MSSIELTIGGMTCASCARRVEKRLNRLDGVTATVNYATEKASVTVAGGVTRADLIAQVEKAGYTAAAVPDRRSPGNRLLVSAVLAAPVIALSMLPALRFASWQWVALALATPVVGWGGWPFHHAAVKNLRLGAATMDTLVSMGTVAAFAWS